MVILLVMFMGFDVGKNSGFTTKNRDVFWDSSRWLNQQFDRWSYGDFTKNTGDFMGFHSDPWDLSLIDDRPHLRIQVGIPAPQKDRTREIPTEIVIVHFSIFFGDDNQS